MAVVFLSIIHLALSQKRRCHFQVKPNNPNYHNYGDVNGSEQRCNFTDCCVGYYLIKDGKLEIDSLGCYLKEKSCSDLSCSRKRNILRCVCSSDFCNSNITWILDPDQPLPLTYSYGIYFQQESLNSSLHDPLCACITTQPSEIDIAEVQLLQVVCKGLFATVWEGKYQGTRVAVKMVPKAWQHKFTAERDVYQFSLMEHAGIIHFLGSGSIGTCDVLVLQYAKYGSLHSYLSTNTFSWKSSLMLCQSLSQGLSYLHSDLHREGVHKLRVAHRDLSSSNVLVKADGTCALCDFGCSAILCSGQNRQHDSSRKLEVESPMGTLRYMSPEILQGSVNLNSDWCLQGDVYSLGLVLWEIWMRCSDLSGERVPPHLLPYEYELGANVALEMLLHHVCYLNERPKIPQVWNQHPQGAALQDLLSSCWDPDAEARLSASCIQNRIDSF
ncbi:anti-Muellerian hormone type-2 receptor-like [Eucyclogobius newberryi]|uniref:anti-Muellerian hormone type-2 receptor-like n=1 Tax=Eucyclogobius newberryi TaxID=166745 RepID=UPI003B599E62